MKKIFLVTLVFIVLFSLLNLFSVPALAAEFSSAYDVTYQVQISGITTVTNKISLTNLKSDLYAKQYTILIGSEKIDNIQGFDSLGNLELQIAKKDGSTNIQATFNEIVVGQGKTFDFTLFYNTPEVAIRQGRIWEITIPKPYLDKTITAYQVHLIVPSSFGAPAYLKPLPASGFTWTLDQVSASTINVAFGDHQSFAFELNYDLRNTYLTPRLYQVPLPPDTLYQQIVLESLKPLPENIVIDEDGNWLARYRLLPRQIVNVQVQGSAFIFFEKRKELSLIDPITTKKYLEPKKYWEKDAAEISQLAEKLSTPEKIYRYVVQTLSYDAQRVTEQAERLGAKESLINPARATCMEFTDLFIALCRAAGIPAREINGFGFSDNPQVKVVSNDPNVLHAWPEFYDVEKKIWVPVDPTWEKTTKGIDYFHQLDFNHLALVIHGLSSEMPLAPGGQIRGDQEKKVKITPIEKNLDVPLEKPNLTLRFPQKTIAGLGIKGQIELTNSGQVALHDLTLEVTSSTFLPLNQTIKIKTLPPLASKTINFDFHLDRLNFWGENKITIQLGSQKKEIVVLVFPWFVCLSPYLLGFSCLLTTFTLVLIIYKRLRRPG